MRMMLQVWMPVETGNSAVTDGTLAKQFQSFITRFKPEAAYFFPEDGKRAALFVFDMQDTWQIPTAVEPLFMSMNAKVALTPVMNGDDLQKGLAEMPKLG